MRYGVSNKNGKKLFLHSNDKIDQDHNEWGLHTIEQQDYINSNKRMKAGYRQQDVEEMTVIRLVDVLQQHVVNRYVPAAVNQRDHPPVVVMKVDVEGEEYVVFDDLLKTTLLCNITAISVEFHHNNNKRMVNKQQQRPITNPQENKMSMNMIQRLQQYQQDNNCHFDIILFDTEEYFNDNVVGRSRLSLWCQQLLVVVENNKVPKYCEEYLNDFNKKKYSSSSRLKIHSRNIIH